jgi:hypothetical protein
MAMCSNMEKVIKCTNLVDGYLLTGFLFATRVRRLSILVCQRIRLQKTKIRVVSLGQPPTRNTFPARFQGLGRILAK